MSATTDSPIRVRVLDKDDKVLETRVLPNLEAARYLRDEIAKGGGIKDVRMVPRPREDRAVFEFDGESTLRVIGDNERIDLKRREVLSKFVALGLRGSSGCWWATRTSGLSTSTIGCEGPRHDRTF